MNTTKHSKSEFHEIERFLENEIVPLYDHFDAGHRRDHAHSVMAQCMELATHYPEADMAIALTAAAYHDTGLRAGREMHHTESARIVRADSRLCRWFTQAEIELIADAAEDHRASLGHEPRTIYGRLVAEADRLIDSGTVVRRAVLYGLDHYPSLTRQQQYERMRSHLIEKYGRGGYLQLWIPESSNAARLEQLRQLIGNENALLQAFDAVYDAATSTTQQS